MPVTGLPAAVETTLSALLAENAVKSWKIAGEGANTVVVLRLEPVESERSTNMAEPVSMHSTQAQYFRRKPPSQLRRDQQRTQQHKSTTMDCQRDVRVSDPSAVCEKELQPSSDCDVQQGGGTRSDVDTGVTQVCQNTTGQSAATSEPRSATGVFPHRTDCTHDQTVDNTVGGFDSGAVKRYVAGVSSRHMHRVLRDSSRNNKCRTILSYKSKDEHVIMFESNDIVLVYPVQSDSQHDSPQWMIKQNQRDMTAEERARYFIMRKEGQPVDRTQHGELQARAERDLHTLRSLIIFYLTQ